MALATDWGGVPPPTSELGGVRPMADVLERSAGGRGPHQTPLVVAGKSVPPSCPSPVVGYLVHGFK